MRLHYYGKLDNLESCYNFQPHDLGGVILYLQNAPRFGYAPATMTIKNPALFIKKNDGFYRFVIEDFELNVNNGKLEIDKESLLNIVEASMLQIS